MNISRTENNVYATFKIMTGLYTRNAYEFIHSMLKYNSILLTEPRLHGSFEYAFKQWWIAGKSIACFSGNYVQVAEDGEIFFVFNTTRRKTYILTPRKLVNVVDRFAFHFSYRHDPSDELKAGIEMIKKSFLGKCTVDDRESDIYHDYVGFPLDPFKQQKLQFKREEFSEKTESFMKGKIKPPIDYKPYSTFREGCYADECLCKLFNETLDNLYKKEEA